MFVFFFFKQKTAYEMRISDWSADVCSSDLACGRGGRPFNRPKRALWVQVGGSHLLAGASIKDSGDNQRYDRHDQRRQTEIIDGIAQEEGQRHQQYAETRHANHRGPEHGADCRFQILNPLAHFGLDKLYLFLSQMRALGGKVLQQSHDVITRSEEHPSELQSLMRISYAVFCLNKKK